MFGGVFIKSEFASIFSLNLINTGYKSNKEYLDDNIKMAKMLINYYKSCLEKKTFEQDNKSAEKDFLLASLFISYRMENTNKKLLLPANHIKNCFKFSDLEWFCFLVSLIFDTDHDYRDIILSCSGNNEKSRREGVLNYETVLKIFYFVENLDEIENAYLELVTLKFKMSSLCFCEQNMKIDTNILNFLYFGEKKLSLRGVEVYVPDADGMGSLPVRERTAKRICEISEMRPEDKQFCFCLKGEEGIGKKTLVKRASELMIKGTIIIDMKIYTALSSETFYKIIYSPLREALVINGTICLSNFEVFDEMNPKKYEYLEFLMDNVPKFSREIFILSNNPSSNIHLKDNLVRVDIPLEKLTYKENSALWKSAMKELGDIVKVSSEEIANKFNFTPLQVKSTVDSIRSLWYRKGCKQLKIKDICKCAYSNSISKISNKATMIVARYTWNELILDENEKKMIRSACDQIKYRHIVYDEWGMDSRVVYGRGLSMLFAGPPGTGKTMAAQVVANELGLEIYKTDLSQVISKYIGETEKNLNKLFDEAKKAM